MQNKKLLFLQDGYSDWQAVYYWHLEMPDNFDEAKIRQLYEEFVTKSGRKEYEDFKDYLISEYNFKQVKILEFM